MKYKVGDKVRVKSKEWYDENEEDGIVNLAVNTFQPEMIYWLDRDVTIDSISANLGYFIKEDNRDWIWTDEMFDGLVSDTVNDPKNITVPEGWIEDKIGDGIILCYKPFEPFQDSYRPRKYTSETISGLKQRVATKRFETKLTEVFDELKAFLLDKHSKYGSFYENPPNILTDLSVKDRILSRIEEKLSRLMAGSKDEDTLKDIVGLWFHLQIEENKNKQA